MKNQAFCKITFRTILLFAFLSITPFLKAQSTTPFAVLVEVQQICNDHLGVIEFKLVGNPDDYSYYWTHGPKTLRIENLTAGTYIFVVVNKYGCKQEFSVTISEITGCTLTYEILPTRSECKKTIVLHVTCEHQVIDPVSLNVKWSDGVIAGMTRTVDVSENTDDQYCVHVTDIGLGNCINLDDCIIIPGNSKCGKKNRREVIVNEFYRSALGDFQFVEILVIGSGVCSETFDLRNFHVDDNNGYLIPGNSFVDENNVEQIGVDKGYLTFRDMSAWSHISNGSLIVIHNNDAQAWDNMPEDDPEDSNQDGVYVIAATDYHYLDGAQPNSGTWNSVYDYFGYSTTPQWSPINISTESGADGMQVRYPDGEYSHGISFGENSFSAPNTFELWVTNESQPSRNCRWIGEDYLAKSDFQCEDDNSKSPGQANSIINAQFIESIRDCQGSLFRTSNDSLLSSISKGANTLTVFPNPFENDFSVNFYSHLAGEAKIKLLTISGEVLQSKTVSCEVGNNQFIYNPNRDPTSGMYLFQFTFPDGEKKTIRIIQLH